MSQDNNFFQQNTIVNYQTFSTNFYDKTSSQLQRFNKTAPRIKRVTSLSSAKLNPQNFLNRSVFNHKLYSQKPFNIAVQFHKQKQEQLKELFSFQEYFVRYSKRLQQKSRQQYGMILKNFTHLFKSLHKTQNHNDIENRGQNSVKIQLIRLKQAIERLLNLLMKQIQYKQSKYLQLVSREKAIPSSLNNINNSKLSSINNLLLLTLKKSQQNHKINIKPSISPNLDKKIKTLQQKFNILQFQNKKNIILIDKIQQESNRKDMKILDLQNKISSMTTQINNIKETEENYNYKIKKLKQELEVAHVVKEQNLADKMKYILEF